MDSRATRPISAEHGRDLYAPLTPAGSACQHVADACPQVNKERQQVSNSDLARGFVVGDWQDQDGRTASPYPARLGAQWNGFANPYFDRASADRVMADQRSLLDSLDPEERLGLYNFAWDGETILLTVIPRPGSASAGEADRPGRIEPIDIDGVPHWNLGLGWTWQQVTEDGEPVSSQATAAQQNAYTAVGALLADARESLRLEPGLRRRLDDGSDVIPVAAHLGGYEDHDHTPIPVHVHIGTVTVAPDGASVLTLQYEHQLDSAAPQLPSS
jgi:hypothetical protein